MSLNEVINSRTTPRLTQYAWSIPRWLTTADDSPAGTETSKRLVSPFEDSTISFNEVINSRNLSRLVRCSRQIPTRHKSPGTTHAIRLACIAITSF